MSPWTFRFLRFTFCAYLLCAGLLILFKLVVFSALWEDQEYLTGLILHPAAGMIIGRPREE